MTASELFGIGRLILFILALIAIGKEIEKFEVKKKRRTKSLFPNLVWTYNNPEKPGIAEEEVIRIFNAYNTFEVTRGARCYSMRPIMYPSWWSEGRKNWIMDRQFHTVIKSED